MYEDQDRDAAESGYRAMYNATMNRASAEEQTVRHTVAALHAQFNNLLFNFRHGLECDARQVDLLGAQIAAAIGVVNEMRSGVVSMKAA